MEREKRIYTIATAHLDTVWNWDFEYVLEHYLKNTLVDNFSLFEQFPDYRFNFEGAYRYELFEEYYPELFEKLKEYVAQGKWNVTGSAYENGDVNVPSPEQLFRNILYGNNYFYKTFGKKSNDIFLPDCFGFGWALPSVARHANLKGFSTQKLTWGSAYGCPFDIGLWTGVDGKDIFASLDSRSYVNSYKTVKTNSEITKKLNSNIKKYSLPLTYVYHGVGDVGGAPKKESVETVCREQAENSSNDTKVLISSPTEFFEDLSTLDSTQISRMPKWNNELVMTNHGVGSYTSRAFSKRCNRKNEELADMAERHSVVASNVCGAQYPAKTLQKAWKRTIAHSFHDDLTGTSVERVYNRSWNDYLLSSNQLNSIIDSMGGEVVRNMDTSWTQGVPVVVCNSIEQNRAGVVDITLPSAGFKYVRAFDRNGRELPCQVNRADVNEIHACVCVNVKSLGYKVIDVLYSYEPCTVNTGLRSDKNTIENYKYIVRVDKNGDICSIVDKTLNSAELLSKPIRYEINKYKGSPSYPAWELRYKEIKKYPWEYAEKGVCEVVENGPARVTLKVKQKCEKSSFTYYVSLSAGGQYVSVYNEIEWREFKKCLHNGFHFTVNDSSATYDLGLGAIKRPVATNKLYSVPAQRWADITDPYRNIGISVFSDSKYGWIMQDSHTLKMTVVHSPKNFYRNDSVQGMLDFGKNRYGYAVYSHSGSYANKTQFYARCFNQPLTAFVSSKHTGALGSEYSFGTINNENVIVRAIKKAEDSSEIIVRVNEGSNSPQYGVELSLGNGIISAREVYASEEDIGPAEVLNGKLLFDLGAYEVKTFALTLSACNVGACAKQTYIDLPYNTNIITKNGENSSASIPSIGASIPEEIFPEYFDCGAIKFKTAKGSELNALICQGQKIKVAGNHVYFAAASLHGDKVYNFNLGLNEAGIHVKAVNEPVGTWDLYNLSQTAYIKKDRLAWECTHTHTSGKDNYGAQLYFFMYEINTSGVDEITLPDDSGLMILAATEINENRDFKLVTDLYDSVEKRPFDYKMSHKEKRKYNFRKRISKKKPNQS